MHVHFTLYKNLTPVLFVNLLDWVFYISCLTSLQMMWRPFSLVLMGILREYHENRRPIHCAHSTQASPD